MLLERLLLRRRGVGEGCALLLRLLTLKAGDGGGRDRLRDGIGLMGSFTSSSSLMEAFRLVKTIEQRRHSSCTVKGVHKSQRSGESPGVDVSTSGL